MIRIGEVGVLTLVTAASAVVTAYLYRPRQPGSDEKLARSPAWESWYALPEPDRATWLQLYRSIAQRPDAEDVWSRARRFARLPDAEQRRMGTLYQALRDVLDSLPTHRQLSLRSLPEAARAEAVYRILETEMPERLSQLRRRLGSNP